MAGMRIDKDGIWLATMQLTSDGEMSKPFFTGTYNEFEKEFASSGIKSMGVSIIHIKSDGEIEVFSGGGRLFKDGEPQFSRELVGDTTRRNIRYTLKIDRPELFEQARATKRIDTAIQVADDLVVRAPFVTYARETSNIVGDQYTPNLGDTTRHTFEGVPLTVNVVNKKHLDPSGSIIPETTTPSFGQKLYVHVEVEYVRNPFTKKINSANVSIAVGDGPYVQFAFVDLRKIDKSWCKNDVRVNIGEKEPPSYVIFKGFKLTDFNRNPVGARIDEKQANTTTVGQHHL